MPTYKISGTSNESATVYIIQNEEYVGKKSVGVGSYEILFDSATSSGLVAVAENVQGQIVGFGDVTAVSGTGQSNITLPAGGITIANIYTGNISIDPDGQYGTDTLPASVDLDNTILLLNGVHSNANTMRFGSVALHMKDVNTVEVRIASYNVHDIYYTVLEASSGINSIQRIYDTSTVTTFPKDYTISAVDTSNVWINNLGGNDGTMDTSTGSLNAILTSSTNVRFDSYDSGSGSIQYISAEIIEFE